MVKLFFLLNRPTYKQSTDESSDENLLDGVIDIEIEREKYTHNRPVFDINEDLFSDLSDQEITQMTQAAETVESRFKPLKKKTWNNL